VHPRLYSGTLPYGQLYHTPSHTESFAPVALLFLQYFQPRLSTMYIAVLVLAWFISHVAALKLAVGGAMDPQHNDHPLESNNADSGGAPAGFRPVKVHIRNAFGSPLQAVVVNAAGSPTWGQSQVIHDSVSFTLPSHGNGQITLGHNTNPYGSKIELNNGFDTSVTQVYIDVSYVDGFSVPIVCHCGGLTTGCSKPLFSQHTKCSALQPGPVCINNAPDNGPAEPFFAACRNEAYVISNQSGLGTGNYCSGTEIHCCIGARCGGHKRDLSTAQQMAQRRGIAVS